MRTSDPIGRWAPYDGQRRLARAQGCGTALLLLGLVIAAAYAAAHYGLVVAPAGTVKE